MNTTSASRYLVEIDGFEKIYATKATLPSYKHTPHTHQPGNQRMPEHGVGNFEVEAFSFSHATGNGQVDRQVYSWMKGVEKGLDDKRNARVVIFDKTGRTPLRTIELIGCLPTMFQQEELSGDSSDTAEFSFELQPDELKYV